MQQLTFVILSTIFSGTSLFQSTLIDSFIRIVDYYLVLWKKWPFPNWPVQRLLIYWTIVTNVWLAHIAEVATYYQVGVSTLYHWYYMFKSSGNYESKKKGKREENSDLYVEIMISYLWFTVRWYLKAWSYWFININNIKIILHVKESLVR